MWPWPFMTRPLHEYTDDTPRAVALIQAADAYIIGTPIAAVRTPAR